MSKQEEALQRWGEAQMLAKIELLMAQATDYSFPAGQATAGIQLATMEVPWLLNRIDELKGQLDGRGHQSTQAVGLHARSA